ncbi:MAG: hypothetical protein ABI639_15495 [Thermoanaerobaculia bacterium]
MNSQISAWTRAVCEKGTSGSSSEHLDYFGISRKDCSNPEVLRELFTDAAREVRDLAFPYWVLLVCPLQPSVSAFTQPPPTLDEAWMHLRPAEIPSIYLISNAWRFVKFEVVEARVYYPVPSQREALYLRTFRKLENSEEPDSYVTDLNFESFLPAPEE